MPKDTGTRVAIVGGGISGHAIQQALVQRGAIAQLFSRSTGLDVLADDVSKRLGSFDVIIEATGTSRMSRTKATEFFTRSTTALAAAASASGAHHIVLSIVNCEAPEVQGYGYFAGKAVQEQVARTVSEHLTIVRSTHWFEFAQQTLQRLGIGPVSLIPKMRIKPVALNAVAGVMADVAIGTRTARRIELAGPEVMTLWEMTKQLSATNRVLVPVPLPGSWGRALRQGICVPESGAKVVGPRFTQWLESQNTGS